MTTRSVRRRLPVLVLAVAAMLATLLPATGASAGHKARIAGATRVETAVQVSQATFPSADQAIVARADQFPDALASAYLASFIVGPILLTDGNDLSDATAQELERLGVSTVIIVGGTAAVSASVQDELDDRYEVTRLAGTTRFGTMAEIATFPPAEFVGTLGTSGPTAVIARADGFADALAGSPIAYSGSFPTLLTESETLSPETSSVLDELGIEYALVLGGEAAISPSVVAAIEAKGITVQRLGGRTRTETAVEIAMFASDQLSFDLDSVVLARGDAFPDALAGGPYGGLFDRPILLTADPNTLSSPTRSFLEREAEIIRNVTALGGTAAITEATLEAAVAAAGE